MTDSRFAALEADAREWYEALSLMSYHGTSWGTCADFNEDDVKKTMNLLRRQGDAIRDLTQAPHGPHTTPSSRLRALADDYDANLLTYGEAIALDILISDSGEAVDDFAAEANEIAKDRR